MYLDRSRKHLCYVNRTDIKYLSMELLVPCLQLSTDTSPDTISAARISLFGLMRCNDRLKRNNYKGMVGFCLLSKTERRS